MNAKIPNEEQPVVGLLMMIYLGHVCSSVDAIPTGIETEDEDVKGGKSLLLYVLYDNC